jgi:hypothetical protein
MYTKRFKPKRKIRANTNVDTRKLYENISRKLGRPTLPMRDWKPMRDWQPISRKRDWRVENPVRTLGICIMCHGNIGYRGAHPIVDIPVGVTLIKKNLGGCGNQSYGLYKLTDYLQGTTAKSGWHGTKFSRPVDISDRVKRYVDDSTMTTLSHFDRCIDTPSYNAFVSTKISNPSPSCETFHGPRFYSKLYSFKPYLSEKKNYTYTNNYIMFNYLSPLGFYKSINIVTCTQDDLNDFFQTMDAPSTTNFMQLKQQRQRSEKFKLTTEDIFALIEYARDTIGITHVNMLDLSCNTSIKPFRRNPDVGY